jgi:hypothetical protein
MNEETVDQIDALLANHGERRMATELTPASTGAASAEVLEEEYQKIGWWKGPNATPEQQARQRDFWLRQESPGLLWLVGRLREEWHIDLLDGVASLLSQAGKASIPLLLDELERQPPRDQAEALLKALAWMGETGVEVQPFLTTRLEANLAMLLQHRDTDLREWASGAARLLPQERAVGLLRRRLDAEPDASLRQVIGEIIDAVTKGPN